MNDAFLDQVIEATASALAAMKVTRIEPVEPVERSDSILYMAFDIAGHTDMRLLQTAYITPGIMSLEEGIKREDNSETGWLDCSILKETVDGRDRYLLVMQSCRSAVPDVDPSTLGYTLLRYRKVY